MTDPKPRSPKRITLHLSPERSKEIRAEVHDAAPHVKMSQVEVLLTNVAEGAPTTEFIAQLLADHYAGTAFGLVLKTERDPDYRHEGAEPLTDTPEGPEMTG